MWLGGITPLLTSIAAQAEPGGGLLPPGTTPQDVIALTVIVAFGLGFAVLAFLGLRKKGRERRRILAEASEEADRIHGLQEYVDGKKLPAAQDGDLVPEGATTAGSLAEAEKVAREATSAAERARRERERLEAEAAGAPADDAQQQEAQGEVPPDTALAEARAAEEAAREAAEQAKERAKQLSKALSKTRDGFIGRISKAFGGRAIDEDILEELEAILFTSDIGAKTAERLLEAVKSRVKAKELADAGKLTEALKAEVADILLSAGEADLRLDREGVTVVMIVGVNGAGKTTTIGKLAHQFQNRGKKVLLGAGDTFRAAAVEQLEIWGERNGCPVVKGKEGADPASVLFDAVKRAKDEGFDVVICDTAGRLHTKVNLMEELKKVERVLGKAEEGAPHEVLLVLDATVGQNAIAQAEQFGEAVPLTGIVLTKLDGTAKGGVVIGIADTRGVPVRFIGVGEKIDDLRAFDARQFADALFGDDSARPAA